MREEKGDRKVTGNTRLTEPRVWCPKPNPTATVRLICLPFAGGSPAAYRNWPDLMPPAAELLSVCLPGRGPLFSDPPYTDMQEMARAVTASLVPYLDRPFVLFGHSMGALLGFEITRLLRRAHGLAPALLAVSGHRAPQCARTLPPIHGLPEAEFLERIRKYGGTPAELLANRELMGLIMPALRADMTAVETYRYSPEPPLSCPISVFGGTNDTHVDAEGLQAWEMQTLGELVLRILPGDHFFLLGSERLIISALLKDLARVIPQ
ncbi:MAG: putative thioesterase [Symbiobacteriaceae bacterium]|jgi:medium-chain acyl-[acyl-carrier-protein] hydrolase|nr:putative thioesterase [Symbiobacteriaceae bacterium]